MMPNLNFKNWKREYDHILIHRTNAVMFFPEDEDKRNQYLVTKALPHLTAEGLLSLNQGDDTDFEKQVEKLGLTQHLLLIKESGGFNSNIGSPVEDEIEKQIRKGLVAAAILRHVHAIEQWKPGNGGLLKAYFLLQNSWRKEGRTSRFPSETRTIQKYFDEMQSVAHLWCASSFGYYLGEKMKFPEFKNFLALSECIRKISEEFYPNPRSPSPVLDKNRTWKVPQNITLPKIVFDIPLLTEDEKNILKSYRAPIRPSR